ncbi:hypothetical protein GRJ2_001532500 [Grus japonensis]|uniref:Uncharacterized protein n=1 Tax=Grus japonensis TaxID=30415 RepID=A0ABC9X1D0_GRUJA
MTSLCTSKSYSHCPCVKGNQQLARTLESHRKPAVITIAMHRHVRFTSTDVEICCMTVANPPEDGGLENIRGTRNEGSAAALKSPEVK